jgi:Na+-driven multidrug efflux pump
MRGLGLLKPIVHIVFVSYYIVSPPIEYLFGYVWGYEVSGLYVGQFFGEAYHCLFMVYYVYYHKEWQSIMEEQHGRMEKEKGVEMKRLDN